MNTPAYIAVDFGGGSGRVVAGTVSDGEMHQQEIHRFANNPVQLGDRMYWDFPALYREMVQGMRKAVEAGYHIASIGIDTWGVDFALLDSAGRMKANPVCYRDAAITGGSKRWFAKCGSASLLYGINGIEIIDFNTIFRLTDLCADEPTTASGALMLFMPDLFSYYLTGTACAEYTIASTSGLLNARTREWDAELVRRSGIDPQMLPPIVRPGTIRGYLTKHVLDEIGADYEIPVIAVGSHDTQSAIHTVRGSYPADGTAYLSSGTWSLLGVLLDEPVLTEEARMHGFSNEGAITGQICLLQNIPGLYTLQRLVAEWQAQGKGADYATLTDEAEQSVYTGEFDVDAPCLNNPASMTEAIDRLLLDAGYDKPQSRGDYVMAVLRSLARRYKKGIDGLNSLLPAPVKRLQIIGGGSRNRVLNSLTAQLTGLPVEAGPAEATALGNLLVQHSAITGTPLRQTI